jgi:vitamin B12 transporter
MNWNLYATETLGGYGLLALYGSWQVQRDWSLEARVDNLADKVYTRAIGYTTPGRQAQLTLRWTPAL